MRRTPSRDSQSCTGYLGNEGSHGDETQAWLAEPSTGAVIPIANRDAKPCVAAQGCGEHEGEREERRSGVAQY
jgi:hypothetical protein